MTRRHGEKNDTKPQDDAVFEAFDLRVVPPDFCHRVILLCGLRVPVSFSFLFFHRVTVSSRLRVILYARYFLGSAIFPSIAVAPATAGDPR